MRREGFELSVSRPKVLLQEDAATGEVLEPIEEVVIDLDEEHSGIVVQKMAERKADMMEMKPSGGAGCVSSSMRRRAGSSVIRENC